MSVLEHLRGPAREYGALARVTLIGAVLLAVAGPQSDAKGQVFIAGTLRPRPGRMDPPQSPESQRGGHAFVCVSVVDGRRIPCTKEVVLEGLLDDDCADGASASGFVCGHGLHRHDKQTTVGDHQAGGFLESESAPGKRLERIATGNRPEDPEVLRYTYVTGEMTGIFRTRTRSSGLPPGWHFVKENSPPCESPDVCTRWPQFFVRQPLHVELPAGELRAGSPAYLFPYSRCSKISQGCSIDRDTTDNDPLHRQVHFGRPDMIEALTGLGEAWAEACSVYAADGETVNVPAVAVYSDVSLPLGGLLDFHGTFRGPHTRHRVGVDVDLAPLSVPPGGRCGPYPGGNTYSRGWKSTGFWRDNQVILRRFGLEALHDDPGHLVLRRFK